MSPIKYMTLLYCNSNHHFETTITVSQHHVECWVSHIVASFVAGARMSSVLGRAKTLPLGSVNNYSNTYSCWCEPKFLACGGVHHIKQDIWLQPFSRHHLVAGHLVAVLISCRTLLCYFILGRAGEVETPPRKRLN